MKLSEGLRLAAERAAAGQNWSWRMAKATWAQYQTMRFQYMDCCVSLRSHEHACLALLLLAQIAEDEGR